MAVTIKLGMPANWKAQVPGILAGVGLFLTSYVQAGHTINFHDPLFYAAVFAALNGYFTKAKNVTGGTTANSSSDPTVVAQTAAPVPPKA